MLFAPKRACPSRDFIEQRNEISASPRNPNPERVTAERELKAALETLVDALPLLYCSMFVLRYVKGLSFKEKAQCPEIREEATKIRANRARALLKRYLKDRLGLVSANVFPLLLP